MLLYLRNYYVVSYCWIWFQTWGTFTSSLIKFGPFHFRHIFNIRLFKRIESDLLLYLWKSLIWKKVEHKNLRYRNPYMSIETFKFNQLSHLISASSWYYLQWMVIQNSLEYRWLPQLVCITCLKERSDRRCILRVWNMWSTLHCRPWKTFLTINRYSINYMIISFVCFLTILKGTQNHVF